MFSSPISNYNAKITILNAAAIKENLSYIEKLGLPIGVAQHINSWFILNDVYINDPTIALDIELNSWVLNILKSY